MPLRILIAAAILLLGRAGVLAIDWYFTPQPAQLPEQDLAAFPRQLDIWNGEDVELEKRLIQGSGCDRMVNRTYTNPFGDQVLMSLGVWTSYEVQVPHKPELCYVTAGWELMEKKDLQLELPGGRVAPVRLLFFQRDAERIAVLFWCHFGDRIALDNEDVRRLQQSLRGLHTSLPRAVKVTLQTGVFDQAAAEKRLLSFAALAFAHSQQLR